MVVTLDEYLAEMALQNLDPPTRAGEYIRASRELLEQARGELEKGGIRQAAGKGELILGAIALAVKAYAEWREGRRLASYRELWEYKEANRRARRVS